jgi:hypothetical protein
MAAGSLGPDGLFENRPPSRQSFSPTSTWPEVATILIGSQRPRIARASFNPSTEPGIWWGTLR